MLYDYNTFPWVLQGFFYIFSKCFFTTLFPREEVVRVSHKNGILWQQNGGKGIEMDENPSKQFWVSLFQKAR